MVIARDGKPIARLVPVGIRRRDRWASCPARCPTPSSSPCRTTSWSGGVDRRPRRHAAPVLGRWLDPSRQVRPVGRVRQTWPATSRAPGPAAAVSCGSRIRSRRRIRRLELLATPATCGNPLVGGAGDASPHGCYRSSTRSTTATARLGTRVSHRRKIEPWTVIIARRRAGQDQRATVAISGSGSGASPGGCRTTVSAPAAASVVHLLPQPGRGGVGHLQVDDHPRPARPARPRPGPPRRARARPAPRPA